MSVIAHLDMDSFFVSVELLKKPHLKGLPVIVGGERNRGIVASASYEARKFGIKSGMPSPIAFRLCPNLISIPPSYNSYKYYSSKVLNLLKKYTPLVEPISIDEAYMDLEGTHLLWGNPIQTATLILKDIKFNLGLSASIGIGSNKLIAKIASKLAKPQGIIWVLPGKEKQFLAPLPIDIVPGIGDRLQKELKQLNIKKIKDLQNIGEKNLCFFFGNKGKWLAQIAFGKASTSVQPKNSLPKSISNEMTFSKKINSLQELLPYLLILSEKVGKRLREKNLKAHTIQLKIRDIYFRTLTRSVTYHFATNFDLEIYNRAKEILFNCYHSPNPIRLIGIATSNFTVNAYQPSLFDKTDYLCLYKTIDKIKNKFGKKLIKRLSYLNLY